MDTFYDRMTVNDFDQDTPSVLHPTPTSGH